MVSSEAMNVTTSVRSAYFIESYSLKIYILYAAGSKSMEMLLITKLCFLLESTSQQDSKFVVLDILLVAQSIYKT